MNRGSVKLRDVAKDSGYGAAFDRLAAVTSEALAIAGPGHWPSGGPDAVHVAVRAIDAHRPELTPAEPRVRRGAGAMVRAAVAGGRVRFAPDRSDPDAVRRDGLRLPVR